MKETIKLMLSFTLIFILVNLSGCSKKDDEPEMPDVPEEVKGSLSLSAGDLLFGSESGEKQSVNVRCSGQWSATVDAAWIDLSPKNGNGDGALTITVNSSNTSSQERMATITVTSGELKEEVIITQKAGLSSNCIVTPINIVTLGDQFAFDVNWGKNVAYFQWMVLPEKDAKRLSDEEIVRLVKEEERIVEKDDYFHIVLSTDGENMLLPLTEYIVYTVAHDKNGDRGDLIKTTVKTRGLVNQAYASVSDPEWSGEMWYWDTAINAYAKEYYMYTYSSRNVEDIFDLVTYEIIAAYFMSEDMKNNPADYTPAIQSGSWQTTPLYQPYFYVCTWAKDKDEEWSGVIRYNFNIAESTRSGVDNTNEMTIEKKLKNKIVSKEIFKGFGKITKR